MQDDKTTVLTKLFSKAVSCDETMTQTVKGGEHLEDMLLAYINDGLLGYHADSWADVSDDDYARIKERIKHLNALLSCDLQEKCEAYFDDKDIVKYFSGWLGDAGFDPDTQDIDFKGFLPKVISSYDMGGYYHNVIKTSPKRNGFYCVIYSKELTKDEAYDESVCLLT
jgi:hypothetical protein